MDLAGWQTAGRQSQSKWDSINHYSHDAGPPFLSGTRPSIFSFCALRIQVAHASFAVDGNLIRLVGGRGRADLLGSVQLEEHNELLLGVNSNRPNGRLITNCAWIFGNLRYLLITIRLHSTTAKNIMKCSWGWIATRSSHDLLTTKPAKCACILNQPRISSHQDPTSLDDRVSLFLFRGIGWYFVMFVVHCRYI